MVPRHHRADKHPPFVSAPARSRPVACADIIYFARTPWDAQRERGHHIVTAISQHRRIFYVEPVVLERSGDIDADITCRGDGLFVVTPHLVEGTSEGNTVEALRMTLHHLVERFHIEAPILWYESAYAFSFSRHLNPLLRVYDYPRRSAISPGSDAEPGEGDLLRLADIIFTATQSVFETVRRLRPGSVFLFPDCPVRTGVEAPSKKTPIGAALPSTPKPTVVGSLIPPESSVDLDLLREIAMRRPDITFEVIGIQPPGVPQPNVTYRAVPSATECESLMRRWAAAIFPIESHRARSPFPIATIGQILQLGIPVVATPTTDIVGPLGRRRIIQLAQTAEEFLVALDFAFEQRASEAWHRECSRLLSDWTWAQTARQMLEAISAVAEPYAVPTFPERRVVGIS